MKQSFYNKKIPLNDGGMLLCNLLAGSMIYVGHEELADVNKALMLYNTSSDIEKSLIDEGFLIPDELNEINIIKYNYWKNKMDKSVLNLSIIPSQMCNLSCVYCFQQNQRNSKIMSMEVLEKIYKFVKYKLDSGVKSVNVGWDGGEATLCLDKVASTGAQLYQLCYERGVSFTSDFSTNGYLLNREKLEQIKKMGVTTLGITLAGDQEYHDCLRKTVHGENTFNQILNNIMLAKDYIGNIMLILNIVDNNVESMKKLISDLSNSSLADHVFVTFKRIESYGMKHLSELCMSRTEYNKEVIGLLRHCTEKGIKCVNFNSFDPIFKHCFAGGANAYAVDAEGKLYKCLEQCEEPVGYIGKNGIPCIDETKDIVFDIFEDEKCINCIQLPCCAGGCVTKRKKMMDFCPSEYGAEDLYLTYQYELLLQDEMS